MTYDPGPRCELKNPQEDDLIQADTLGYQNFQWGQSGMVSCKNLPHFLSEISPKLWDKFWDRKPGNKAVLPATLPGYGAVLPATMPGYGAVLPAAMPGYEAVLPAAIAWK